MWLFTLFRNTSFFYWFVWEFLEDCSWVKKSLKMLNFLLVTVAKLFACCLFLITFCLFLVTFWSLLFTFCSLLVTFYSLFLTFCLLLVTFCSLLVTFYTYLVLVSFCSLIRSVLSVRCCLLFLHFS